MIKKAILSFTLMLLTCVLGATTYQVGSTRAYTSPNELYLSEVLQAGDTIEIDAEEFVGTPALAVWFQDNLLIRGVGGRPHLIADGENIWGKGIWVLAGNNITIENIEISGATVPEGNGAGIRLDGIGLTVKNCYIHHNENGILTSNQGEGIITIEHSEFAHNGYGEGYTHNLYIGHVHQLIFRYNYSHHANVGHNLKSRANENYIFYNRIMDEETGNSSRLIDLPNGGFSMVIGNLLMQGENAPNNNMVGYGLEGLVNPFSNFYFINNTMVNKRSASCLFLDIAQGTEISNVSNNVFAGTGELFSSPPTNATSNLFEENIADLLFIDEANYNYRLMENSPAIDYGSILAPVNGFSLVPDGQYLHPVNFETRFNVGPIDAGAYEYSTNNSAVGTSLPDNFKMFPNPSHSHITVENIVEYKILSVRNSFGQIQSIQIQGNRIDITNLSPGIYYLIIEARNGFQYRKQFVKI